LEVRAPSQLDAVTGKITWPEALQSEPFAKFREELDSVFQERAQGSGAIGQDAKWKAQQATSAMLQELRQHIRELRPADYLAAHKMINALADESAR
jgi:hypothetical protein